MFFFVARAMQRTEMVGFVSVFLLVHHLQPLLSGGFWLTWLSAGLGRAFLFPSAFFIPRGFSETLERGRKQCTGFAWFWSQPL